MRGNQEGNRRISGGWPVSRRLPRAHRVEALRPVPLSFLTRLQAVPEAKTVA